jgi:hypothetical protein
VIGLRASSHIAAAAATALGHAGGSGLEIGSKVEAVQAANRIFDRDPAHWTDDDIASLRHVLLELPGDIAPRLPRRPFMNGVRTRLTVKASLDPATRAKDPAKANDMLRRYGVVFRALNDPALTPAGVQDRVRFLLKQGLHVGWSGPGLLSELRMLVTEFPPDYLGPSHVIERLPMDALGKLWSGPWQPPAIMDRPARALLATLEHGRTKESTTNELRAIIDRDPATWSRNDLVTLQTIFDMPFTLTPCTDPSSMGVKFGSLWQLANTPDHRLEDIVARALDGEHTPTQLSTLRRHAATMRELLNPERGTEQAAERLRPLFAKDPATLTPSELDTIRTLTIDIPPKFSVRGPYHLPRSVDLAAVLDAMRAGRPLTPALQLSQERLWRGWRISLDRATPPEEYHARFNAIIDREPETWTPDEVSFAAAIVGYPFERITDGFLGRPQTPDPFFQFEETRRLTKPLTWAIEASRYARSHADTEQLCERIDRSESLRDVIGSMPPEKDQEGRREYFKTQYALIRSDHPWTLRGAANMADLLEQDLSMRGLAQLLSAIHAAIAREPSGSNQALIDDARHLLERNQRRITGTPLDDEPVGYGMNPDYAELGDLRAKLTMAADMHDAQRASDEVVV